MSDKNENIELTPPELCLKAQTASESTLLERQSTKMWWLALPVLLLVVAAVVLRCWQKMVIKRCKLKEIDWPVLPLVGHGLITVGGNEVMAKKIVEAIDVVNKQGGTAALWVGCEMVVMTSDPRNSEYLLKKYLEKGFFYQIIKVFLGNGILIADVPTWRQHRRICAPLFSPKNLSLFVEIFARRSATMTKLLRNEAGRGPTELWPYLVNYTFDAVCNTTLGINIDAQNNPDHPFLTSFLNGSEIIAKRLISPWYWPDFLYKLLPPYRSVLGHRKICHDFIEKVLNKSFNKTIPANDNEHKIPDLTEIMQSSDSNLSIEEQRDEVIMFVAAGLDTSAVGMSFTLHMLAKHQDVQEKIYRELKEVLGDSNREVQENDLSKMQYLECVIKETLRLFTPAPIIARTPETDVLLPTGEAIPKGTCVIIGLCGVHRNPKYWGADADQFRPERFLEPFTHPKQYMPFSDGPRNCIGYRYALLSMKTALATMMTQYKVFPATYRDSNLNRGCSNTNDELPYRLKYDVTVKDSKNVKLCLELRE